MSSEPNPKKHRLNDDDMKLPSSSDKSKAVENISEIKSVCSFIKNEDFVEVGGYGNFQLDFVGDEKTMEAKIAEAKVKCLTELETMLKNYREKESFRLSEFRQSHTIEFIKSKEDMLEKQVVAFGEAYNSFILSLDECSHLDTGFNVKEEMTCYCPCRKGDNDFKMKHSINADVLKFECKNNKPMAPKSISQHLIAMSAVEGFSCSKIMHHLCLIYLKNKYPECFGSNGMYRENQNTKQSSNME